MITNTWFRLSSKEQESIYNTVDGRLKKFLVQFVYKYSKQVLSFITANKKKNFRDVENEQTFVPPRDGHGKSTRKIRAN